ncbi:alginate export family protein [Flavobacteriaceae bacterium S0825]|uniref:alginate export family protein n=1 Tax=Gaetbulibacter sp. S0825 TaxID=2720084 RepID=UPI001431B499|nr:alginate export family protein [Gaetbulibacter sp. S0825]MCK0109955.1 alginate export family protein [Flavobacteriaceae bacterium S0825]NIX65584.1 alginate export family protein [Gaetbulibacter sp. S0825]
MKKIILAVATIILCLPTVLAQQLDISAELRPRYENKHGFGTLLETDADGSNFISQRTRLNFDFKQDNLIFKLSMQNVRVWGDVSTLASDDNATALHEAWGEALFGDGISLKLGRQEISYDDQRIFGSVGWAQQARSHDAFLFKYAPNANNRLDIGLALNSDSQSNLDNLYSNAAGYKTFQYAWYHGNFDNLGLSVLLLNTGIEYLDSSTDQTIDYMQTIGSRLTYKFDKFNVDGAAYLQAGKAIDNDVSASNFTGNLAYKVSSDISLGIGYEYLSGKDQDDVDSDIKSFMPLFGTNHKFNGLMDYFYVGNHGGSVGLNDISFTFSYQKDKFSAKLVPHLFSSAADIYDGSTKMDNNLGTEIDLTFGYKLSKDITLNAGYSKMLATDSMEILKGGDSDENNSWAWLMFTFKPKLFSTQQQ